MNTWPDVTPTQWEQAVSPTQSEQAVTPTQSEQAAPPTQPGPQPQIPGDRLTPEARKAFNNAMLALEAKWLEPKNNRNEQEIQTTDEQIVLHLDSKLVVIKTPKPFPVEVSPAPAQVTTPTETTKQEPWFALKQVPMEPPAPTPMETAKTDGAPQALKWSLAKSLRVPGLLKFQMPDAIAKEHAKTSNSNLLLPSYAPAVIAGKRKAVVGPDEG